MGRMLVPHIRRCRHGGAGAPPASGYEDFTTYTEVDAGGDPGNLVVIDATHYEVDGMTTGEDTHLDKDRSAVLGAATFRHYFRVTPRAISAPGTDQNCGLPWAVTNVVDDLNFWITNNSQAIAMYFYNSTAHSRKVALRDCETGNNSLSGADVWTAGVEYFCEARRPDETTVYVKAYLDAANRVAQTNEQWALANVTITSGRRYSDFMPVNSYNVGNAPTIDFDGQDYDLEVA